MSRRILFLLLPLLFATAISTHAQSRADEFVWQDSQPIRQIPEPPWVADMRPNPRYPITVPPRHRLQRLATGARTIAEAETATSSTRKAKI